MNEVYTQTSFPPAGDTVFLLNWNFTSRETFDGHLHERSPESHLHGSIFFSHQHLRSYMVKSYQMCTVFVPRYQWWCNVCSTKEFEALKGESGINLSKWMVHFTCKSTVHLVRRKWLARCCCQIQSGQESIREKFCNLVHTACHFGQILSICFLYLFREMPEMRVWCI